MENLKNILFVCGGNTCRSPMAATIYREELERKKGKTWPELQSEGYLIDSAGIKIEGREKFSEHAVKVLEQMGYHPDSTYRPKLITSELVNEADRIYVMRVGHLKRVIKLVPEAEGKTYLLGGDKIIFDPVGFSLKVYQRVAAHIQERVRQII